MAKQIPERPESDFDEGGGHPLLEEDRQHLRHDNLDAASADALFLSIAAQTVDKAPTWRDRLRELPTPRRVILGSLAMVALVGALVLSMGVRPGLSGGAAVRFSVALVGILALAAATTALSLRGYHRRPLGGWVWAALGAAIAGPIILALIPGLWSTSAGALGHGHGAACFAMGAVTGLLIGTAIYCLQRADRPAPWRLASAGAVGGLTAFVALQLHCPSQAMGHILAGHASVGLVLAGLGVLYARLRE